MDDVMLSVTLNNPRSPDDFLVVRETLTRIGLIRDKQLLQVCYIYHDRGNYHICHHKELENQELDEEDLLIRNQVAAKLDAWGLVRVVDREAIEDTGTRTSLRTIKYQDRDEWELVPLYDFKNKIKRP